MRELAFSVPVCSDKALSAALDALISTDRPETDSNNNNTVWRHIALGVLGRQCVRAMGWKKREGGEESDRADHRHRRQFTALTIEYKNTF